MLKFSKLFIILKLDLKLTIIFHNFLRNFQISYNSFNPGR